MKKKLIETYVFFIVAALVCVFLVDAYNSNRSGKITIFNAAIYGQSDLIKEYVKQGKDMNSQDEYGATLLHYSLQSGHTGISKFLVISEADVNIMDKEELTPLDWAHWMNQVETAKLIREYGGKTGEELKAAEN